jgi:hypothetical protein
MKADKNKYETFSKVFAELSNESQNLLIEIANQLLKAHQNIKEVKISKKTRPGKTIENV